MGHPMAGIQFEQEKLGLLSEKSGDEKEVWFF
jgi:hypothetical protein